MIVHVVLFEPRAGLAATDLAGILSDIQRAAASVPSIRRFRVGRRTRHGRPGYEQMMTLPLTYAAVVEFDDLDGLTAYLSHPAHEALAGHFATAASHTLAYDYEMADAADAARLLA